MGDCKRISRILKSISWLIQSYAYILYIIYYLEWMELLSRSEGNPSIGANPLQIRVEKLVSGVTHFSSVGNTNKQHKGINSRVVSGAG